MTERTLPGIGLTGFWDQGAPWKVGGDQNWLRSSVLTQLAVESATTSLPASPLNGVIYIVPVGDPNANQVAARDNGAWVYMPPSEGWTAYVRDTGVLMNFDGTDWVPSTTPLAAALAASDGAALVGVVQPEAGAVERSVEAELRAMIRPEQFGAVGNGIADDYLALAASVAAAKVSGIGVVNLGKKYSYGTTLVVPSGVALVGGDKRHLDSGRDYHLVYTGGGCAISIDRTTDSSFQHLTRLENLLINYAGVTANTDGIQQSLSSVLMRNVQVYNFTRHGFNLGTSIFSYYENLFAQACGGTGIYGVSTDPVYPGGQCVFMNPQVFRCQTGMIFDNYQTVRVEGGTVALNTQQQAIVRGGQGLSFSGTFFEPQLGGERTYFGNLVEVSGSTISAGSAKNIAFIGCNLYAGQSGATARNNYGIYIGNATNVIVKHNVVNGFRAAGVKIVFDTNVVTNYEVGPNYYTDNVADFDRAGSSSQGIDSTTSTRTLTNQNETYSGTSKLTVQGTHTAPMAYGSFNVWVDPDGKFLRKSGTPGTNVDGTSIGFGSAQPTVGAAGAASALPATPTGYVTFRQGGNEFVIPYYAKT